MSSNNSRPEGLIAEGKAFITEAVAICNTCDQLKTTASVKRCGVCGCLASFKIVGAILTKSKCPLGKW